MVLDLWLGGQTYNPVIKMLKKCSPAKYVKKYKLSTMWTRENTPLTSWRHVEDRSSGGRKLEFLTFLTRERF